ncbi:MAG: tRNA (adenosine(37)-N6)-threonylcarbamoyltransferase complex transferase subunit TsaD, partial [Proteobacteria bacterium]|nr:tRNA (adenosine(37)-N6)-threonylcarbamoyltransferase complex transferase subunit TsaD [Pseudomonadota bacterium]
MSLILGIETSCDETAAAVVRNGKEALSSVVKTQIDVHRAFGGVVPEIAAREHLRLIDHVVDQALLEAGCELSAIDAIAITQGPGLVGALLVGIAYAKGLALASHKPLVPVNHVEAHIHGAILGLDLASSELYPCLALVVSGGHTNIYFMPGPTVFELMAYSIDDACGESFDKVAKLFGLGYPGGPVIEENAKSGNASRFPMPHMMEQKDRLLFSYSGLKTYMVNLRARHAAELNHELINDFCAGFQEEALSQLLRKLASALQIKPSSRAILVAGGVAANQRFRDMALERLKV